MTAQRALFGDRLADVIRRAFFTRNPIPQWDTIAQELRAAYLAGELSERDFTSEGTNHAD